MSQSNDFWNIVDKRIKNLGTSPVQVGKVSSLNPLTIDFNGIVIGKSHGDTIYINSLLQDANINLNLSSMDQEQNINPALWKAQDTPTSTVAISGTQKQFLTDFYNFFKNWQKRYIIEIGNYVAVQKLGNNTYLILEKVQASVI